MNGGRRAGTRVTSYSPPTYAMQLSFQQHRSGFLGSRLGTDLWYGHTGRFDYPPRHLGHEAVYFRPEVTGEIYIYIYIDIYIYILDSTP